MLEKNHNLAIVFGICFPSTMTELYGIKSFDFHTYWNNNNPKDREFAFDFREKIIKEFANEIEAGDVRVFKFWDKPIGPHPLNMFEIDTGGVGRFKPELYARLVTFYIVNHGHLSVLIHPKTDKGDLIDHTQHALWLGHKVRLDTSFLH